MMGSQAKSNEDNLRRRAPAVREAKQKEALKKILDLKLDPGPRHEWRPVSNHEYLRLSSGQIVRRNPKRKRQ